MNGQKDRSLRDAVTKLTHHSYDIIHGMNARAIHLGIIKGADLRIAETALFLLCH